jgi:hypothetical protein
VKASPPTDLRVNIDGLYLVEEKGKAASIHLIDAAGVGMAAHLPQLKVLASTIDQSQTTKPDPAHVIPAGSDEFWLWDLQGVDVTMPSSDSGNDDFTLPGSSADDGLDIPASDAGWNSLARLPDLKVCCGATKIDKPQLFASSIALRHGRLDVMNPKFVGERAVWQFTDPSGKTLAHRAFSNKVQYACQTNGAAAIHVGTVPIVFKPGTAEAWVANLPTMKPAPCPAPCTPNMAHFTALCHTVDKKFDPAITLAAFSAQANGDAGPDYCPGGRI